MTACSEQADPQQGAQQQAPEVGVVTVALEDVQLTRELPGRLEPTRIAQVRARADGVVLKRLFEEGSNVKSGQKLYQIDAAPYEANLQSARASLAQAEATLADASATARRYAPLVEARAVSQQEYDAAVAAAKAAQAQLAAAKAAVRNADISLGYTTVTAPIAGHIGRSLVTEGALVSAQQATELATIQQVGELYVNVTQPVAEVLQMREDLRQGKLTRAEGEEAAEVEIILESGSVYPHRGRLLFTDLTVDPGTSQVTLRAVVPNPDGDLLPGMYVRARLEQARLNGVMLLPQQSVSMGGSQGNTVTVVKDDGSLESRTVTVEGVKDQQWIVTAGLQPGEQVVADGQMRIIMGAQKVKPVPWRGDGDGDGQASPGAESGPDAAAEADRQP